MMKLIIKRGLSFDDYYEFLDWLYNNGFHIVKEYDSPPKSKFMEEWSKSIAEWNRLYFVANESTKIDKLVELIDKHKEDKEGG